MTPNHGVFFPRPRADVQGGKTACYDKLWQAMWGWGEWGGGCYGDISYAIIHPESARCPWNGMNLLQKHLHRDISSAARLGRPQRLPERDQSADRLPRDGSEQA